MKNLVLTISFLGSLAGYVLFNTRDFGFCDPYCGDWVGKYQTIFLFFPLLFVISAAVYVMPQRVFTTWWKFASIATPVILFLSWLISLGLHHSPGGFFNMDNEFDLIGLMVMYAIFMIGSIIQILRGYKSI